jgi:hypothetical protein
MSLMHARGEVEQLSVRLLHSSTSCSQVGPIQVAGQVQVKPLTRS